MVKRLFFIVFLSLAALLTGCSKDVSYSMHNPTESTISVRIDDKTYSVEPMKAVNISLAPGKHELESSFTGKVNFIIYGDRKGGLLNPTLSDYVIVNEIYITEENKAKNFRPQVSVIVIDGQAFEGSFKKVNGLFISEQWTYDVLTPYPKEIKVSQDNKQGGNIVSKIFSQKEFIEYYKFNYGRPSASQNSQPQLSKDQILALNKAPVLPVFKDEKMQKASIPLRDFYDQYILAADTKVQTKLQEQFHDLMMNFVHETATLHSNMGREENEKSNTFVHIVSNVLGTGALIVD